MSSLFSPKRRQSAGKRTERAHVGLIQSQLILFNSRRKWGLLYSLATVAGLFCVPGVVGAMAADTDALRLIQKTAPLPLISLLVATGMYILNDLVDADLDKANGKKRPIPSGRVSKKQAWIFILSTNGTAILLSALTFTAASVMILLPMLAIGVMYSAPRVELMNRFLLKTFSISIFYVMCALLGMTSSYGIGPALDSPAVPLYSLALLGTMIFISSTLNDLGDVSGDRKAGRRTIPVVIGPMGTIKLLVVLALGMIGFSLLTFGIIGVLMISLATAFALILTSRLVMMKRSLEIVDVDSMRRQHKKIFPMHVVLQSVLAVGAVTTL